MLVKFEIYSDGEFWCARGIGEDIFTQGESLDELAKNIEEAVEVHFEEEIEKSMAIKILSIAESEGAMSDCRRIPPRYAQNNGTSP